VDILALPAENVINSSFGILFGVKILNRISASSMVVLDPIKLVITNYPEDKEESLDAAGNNQEDDEAV
jgi:glutaminyl-tRNA synthetase